MPRYPLERRALLAAVALAVIVLAVAATSVVAGGAPATPAVVASSTPTGTPGTLVATGSVVATGSKTTTVIVGVSGSYALDFTLPTFGKSGCLVCHGDPNLVIAKGDTNVSFWIDEEAYSRSAHAKVICTGCHVDYGYKAPHGQGGQDWRAVAKQSCKNCHADQFDQWALGGHAPKPGANKQPDPKAASKPLCGDCHGGHDIPVLKDNPAGKAALHAQSQQMCGRSGCHADYWESYSDYYHGAAYKAGAEDAPACWDCHGTHNMMKSTARLAPMNPENFGQPESCGRCHEGATSAYAAYSKAIHGKRAARDRNPIYRAISKVFGR